MYFGLEQKLLMTQAKNVDERHALEVNLTPDKEPYLKKNISYKIVH